MSTLRVNNLQNISTTDGGISIDTSGHVTVDGVAMPSAGPLSNRNRIINGDMRIDQRNAGASVTPTSDVYTLDRWIAVRSQASKFSVQQNTVDAPVAQGFTHCMKVTSLSAYTVASSDYFTIDQSIEGLNIGDLAWGTASAKTVTLSFWVRSSLTGTFGGAFTNSNLTRSYPFTYAISSANTWEQKSIVVAGDTSGTWLATNGLGVEIRFGLGVGSTYSGTAGVWSGSAFLGATGATSVVGTNGATFYITGVQLEVGSVATPFEHRNYGTELALCQRYYQQRDNTIYVSRGYSNEGYVNYAWPVTMRDDPILVMTTTFVTSNSLTADIYGMRGYILSSWDQGSVSINSMTVSAEL
jgi:hypothetical protein